MVRRRGGNNLLIYYEEGNPRGKGPPDVFVMLGAPSRDRSSYLLWQEPKAPDFVLEITSLSTYREYQGKKRAFIAGCRCGSTGSTIRPATTWSRRCRGLELVAGVPTVAREGVDGRDALPSSTSPFPSRAE